MIYIWRTVNTTIYYLRQFTDSQKLAFPLMVKFNGNPSSYHISLRTASYCNTLLIVSHIIRDNIHDFFYRFHLTVEFFLFDLKLATFVSWMINVGEHSEECTYRLRNIAMPDYQESETTGQTDAVQSDPFMPLCFACNTKTSYK